MQTGVVFPHWLLANHTDQLADFLDSLEERGLEFLSVFDHVAGAPAEDLAALPFHPYSIDDPFLEVMVLLGFAAAATSRIEIGTCVLVLPQRQTLLAAKQLQTIDLLSGGRLRVGLGVGWNSHEYAGLGAPFARRGDLLDEQVEVLGSLWSQEVVEAQGEFHSWPRLGLRPSSGRRIPLWFGGNAHRALDRVAQWGDGWIPSRVDARTGEPMVDLDGRLSYLEEALDRAGRSRRDIGLEGRVVWTGDPEDVERSCASWLEAGATRLCLHIGAQMAGTIGKFLDEAEEALHTIRAVVPARDSGTVGLGTPRPSETQ